MWSTDLAPFESKTKEDYAWRKEFLEGAKDYEVDIHDKSTWCKGTIFEIKKQTISPDRVIDVAYCAFRVYRPNSNALRRDERGVFEGWSVKFDEWIPIYSPRIAFFQSKTDKADAEEMDLEEDLDDLIEVEPGFKRVFAVPRIFKCISAQFMHHMNMFGNMGGFEMIVDTLENGKVDDNGDLNIAVMSVLAQIISLPYPIYHKAFIAEYGQRIAAAIKMRLLSASDKSLRDVRKQQIDGIIKAIDSISKRFLDKEERDKQSEIMKLELCNKCLGSEFLERRIQGIRELNDIIKNTTLYMSSKSFKADFLIDWMLDHEVLSTIWSIRKTHLQLV